MFKICCSVVVLWCCCFNGARKSGKRWQRAHNIILGNQSNDDGDSNENCKKAIGLNHQNKICWCWTVHSPLFFRKIFRMECLPLRIASYPLACKQALLFGQAKRASRERASDGPRKGELATISLSLCASRLRRSLARSRETRFNRPNRRACSQATHPLGQERVTNP